MQGEVSRGYGAAIESVWGQSLMLSCQLRQDHWLASRFNEPSAESRERAADREGETKKEIELSDCAIAEEDQD